MKILGVFAHREDQIVCGWPLFQNRLIERHLILCSVSEKIGDEHPILQSCKIENIRFVCGLGVRNGFFRSIKQNEGYSLADISEKLCKVIKIEIEKLKPDYIFTHNPFGEYGHFDHRLVFEIIYNNFSSMKILISDIKAYSAHTLSPNSELPRMWRHFYKNKHSIVKPNGLFYKRNAELFSRYNLWTENKRLNLPLYPAKSAWLYELGPEN